MRKETERRHTELKLELVSWTESETKSKQESKAKGRSSEGRSSAGHQLRTSRWEDHRPSWEDHRPSWEAGAGADSPQLSQERTAHGASAWLRNSEGKTPSIVPAGAAGWDAAWSDDPSVSIAVIFSGTKVTASS